MQNLTKNKHSPFIYTLLEPERDYWIGKVCTPPLLCTVLASECGRYNARQFFAPFSRHNAVVELVKFAHRLPLCAHLSSKCGSGCASRKKPSEG